MAPNNTESTLTHLIDRLWSRLFSNTQTMPSGVAAFQVEEAR